METTSLQRGEIALRQVEIAPRRGEITARHGKTTLRRGEITARQGETTLRQGEITLRRCATSFAARAVTFARNAIASATDEESHPEREPRVAGAERYLPPAIGFGTGDRPPRVVTIEETASATQVDSIPAEEAGRERAGDRATMGHPKRERGQ